MDFNERIRQKRKEKNMTQADLADKVGVSHATIARYEKGTIPLTVEMMQKIASFLEIDISDLLYADRQQKVQASKEILTESIIAEIVAQTDVVDAFYYGYDKEREEWLFAVNNQNTVISADSMNNFWDRVIKHASIELLPLLLDSEPYIEVIEERDGKTVLIRKYLNNGK